MPTPPTSPPWTQRITLLLLLLLLPLTTLLHACLPYQTKANPLSLKPNQYVTAGKYKRKLRVYEAGNPANPHIVLLHGYGSSGIIWLPLMKTLTRYGYHTIALDLPGFGYSDKFLDNYETWYIAAQVAEVMRKKGIKTADVIAHSWGSSVALALTLQRPKQIRRIVLHGGWVYSNQLVPVLRWAKTPVVGEIIFGLFFQERPADKYASSLYDPNRMVDMRVLHKIHEAYKRPGYIAAALAVARGMNFRKMEKRYKTIRQPTLLLWGKQDRVALPFYGRRLASEMPNARFVLIDRCGHIPMLEQPHQTHRHVVSFLRHARRLKRTR